MLYELLGDTNPYHLKSSRLSEIENAICDKNRWPSMRRCRTRRLRGYDDASLCEARSTKHRALRTRFARDLPISS